MLTPEHFSRAMATEKAMYRALTDLEELTGELAQAATRGDRVSLRMYLSLRQEPLEQLSQYKAALDRQCASLSEPDGRMLRDLLNQPSPPACPGSEELVRQVARTRALWERVVRADRQISLKLTGSSSFYNKEKPAL